MDFDKETAERITQNTAWGGMIVLVAVACWRFCRRLIGLPARVDAIEGREGARDRYLLAMGAHQMATGKDKTDAKEQLREAHGEFMQTLTDRKKS